MAISPEQFKERYQDLPAEELETKYEQLKKEYCFDTKDAQIDYGIRNYLRASKNTNNNREKEVLEALLKEKTGKDYSFEPKKFDIELVDIINFMTEPKADPYWAKVLSDYFQKLDNVDESDKKRLLIELAQNKDIFNDFTKEIAQAEDANDVYNRYKKAIEEDLRDKFIKS